MLGSATSQALRDIFKNQFSGRMYATQKNGPGNIIHQKELHRIFQSDLAKGETLLEVGAGPMAWYSFMSSSRFNDIVLSDLVENNRVELEKWLNRSEDAIDWTCRAEQVAALEGYRDIKKGALAIMERTRSSIRKVVPCDVLKPGVLPEEHKEIFDVVLSCNCLECVSADLESFQNVVKNVGSLVKAGGLLVLAGVGGMGDYYMGNKDFPMVNLTEDVLKSSVTDAGFQIKTFYTEIVGGMGSAGAFVFVLAAHNKQ